MVLYRISAFLFTGIAVKICFIHDYFVLAVPASVKEDCLMAQKKLESVFRTFQLSSFIL